MLIKILKVVFIIAIVAVIGVFGVYNGILQITNEAGAALVVPTTLNYYPTDLVADGYVAEFPLEDFLNGAEFTWGKKDWEASDGKEIAVYTTEVRKLKGTWDDTTKQYTAPSDPQDAVYDAISIFLIATYNEATIPYYQYYLDAGGIADIGGALSGGLMVQGIVKVNNEGEYRTYYKEQINALANVQASDFLKNAAAAIPSLNKAEREGTAKNKYYFHKGNSPVYITETAVGQFPSPACDDPGYTAANWESTADDKVEDSKAWAKTKDADAKWRTEKVTYWWDGVKKERDPNWDDLYGHKYIIDLQYDDVWQKWFTNAQITTVFTDVNGVELEDQSTVSDYWYLRTSFSADLPELPEGFDDMEGKAQKAYLEENGFYEPAVNQGGKGMFQSLQGYTGANPGVIFTKLTYSADVWNIGIFQDWKTDEGWFGSMVLPTLQANVRPYSPQVYSYAKAELTEEVIIADLQANVNASAGK